MTETGRSYLLDTHVAIWLDAEPGLVNDSVHEILADLSCEIYLSAVSFWELAIKQGVGKYDPGVRLEVMAKSYGIHELAITAKHADAVRGLPRVHGDPFDRMLVAQAMVERMTLVTADGRLAGYAVSILRV